MWACPPSKGPAACPYREVDEVGRQELRFEAGAGVLGLGVFGGGGQRALGHGVREPHILIGVSTEGNTIS